ncbi:MAG TPA: hypothetical protein VFW42_03020 [Fluviicoccus sp.]|nr:hypothetical protein [Fluviicoccus sp.]
MINVMNPKLAVVVILFLCGIAHANECNGRRSLNNFGYKLYCESDDFKVGRNHDGFFAWLQGHSRGSGGETPYGWPGYEMDMNFHVRDVRCCAGDGLIVGDRSDPFGSIIKNGYIYGKTGVFSISGGFRERRDFTSGCGYEEDMVGFMRHVSRGYGLINMRIEGDYGGVAANDVLIRSSVLIMDIIKLTGLDLVFEGNYFVLTSNMENLKSSASQKKRHVMFERYKSDMPYHENNAKSFVPTALYLSCADNATISNNIFTAKRKTPGAYAIVLKHSKNVRITNNTFEGFDVPVLMDKYSSIIDDRGNVIKPDVTINSPQSRLYKVDLDHVQGDKSRPWWQFWR